MTFHILYLISYNTIKPFLCQQLKAFNGKYMVLPKNRAVSRYLQHFLVGFSRVIDMKAIKRILVISAAIMVSANSLAMDNPKAKENMNKKIIVDGNNKFALELFAK